MAHPAAHALAVTATLVVLGMLLYILFADDTRAAVVAGEEHRRRGRPMLLRRSIRGVRGVAKRHRFRCVERARGRLVDLGDTPAVLVQSGAYWYVLSGPQLTVVAASVDDGGADSTVAEFTVRGQPAVVASPEDLALDVTSVTTTNHVLVVQQEAPPPAPAPAAAPAPTLPPSVQELRGRSGAVLLASIDSTQKQIPSYPTLEQAVSAARPYDARAPTVDYIVGGSANNPLYYVVTVMRGDGGGGGGGDDGKLKAVGPPDSHIWVRVDPSATTTPTDGPR